MMIIKNKPVMTQCAAQTSDAKTIKSSETFKQSVTCMAFNIDTDWI